MYIQAKVLKDDVGLDIYYISEDLVDGLPNVRYGDLIDACVDGVREHLTPRRLLKKP